MIQDPIGIVEAITMESGFSATSAVTTEAR